MWGDTASTRTEKADLEFLQDRGGLGDVMPMPRTVAHVVGLTRLLGERYLWVDRFCIVQDDGPDKQAQLDAMADIYAGALATIVAAAANDADKGLRGIRDLTPRTILFGGGHRGLLMMIYSARMLWNQLRLKRILASLATRTATTTRSSYPTLDNSLLIEAEPDGEDDHASIFSPTREDAAA